MEVIISAAVPPSAFQHFTVEQIRPGISLGQIEFPDPLIIEYRGNKKSISEHILQIQRAASGILREFEEHRPHQRSSLLMSLQCESVDIRHQTALQVDESAKHIAGFLIKDPGHSVGIRTMQTAVGREKSELDPAFVEIRLCRCLESGDVMAPVSASAGKETQAAPKSLCHRDISCRTVSAPVNGELLGSCRGRSGKEDCLVLPPNRLNLSEDRLVVQEGIVVVHRTGIFMVAVNHIGRYPFSEIRLDAVDPCFQQGPDLAGIPYSGCRIREVYKGHPRLPVIYLLDAFSV